MVWALRALRAARPQASGASGAAPWLLSMPQELQLGVALHLDIEDRMRLGMACRWEGATALPGPLPPPLPSPARQQSLPACLQRVSRAEPAATA